MSSLIHTHTLSSGLICILSKMIEAVHRKNKNEIHLQRDLDLTHNEYANAQKLHYFSLAHRIEGKAGYYCITKRGGEFLRNEIGIPIKITTQDNYIIGKSEQLKMIKDFYPYRDNAYFQSIWKGINFEQPSLF